MDHSITQRQPPLSARDNQTRRFGRYTLRGLLASGGMADVYAAELESLGGFRKRVAIKRMRPHLVADPVFVGMFLEEARLGSQLTHPKICEVFELGEVDGEYYMAMEYLHGVTLSSLLAACSARGQTLPLPIAAGIFAQACEGLHYAHERKDRHGNSMSVIHRDVSPQNLFIRDDGVVKVLDFGIAKTEDGGHVTSTGSLKGKDAYMSPEQLQGKQLDRRSDIWSLGVVMFEAFTGTRLFRRGALMETVYAIVNAPIPPLSQVRSDAPAALVQVVARALSRERNWRFASAEKLRLALQEAMGSEGAASPQEIGALVRGMCHTTLQKRELMFEAGSGLADDEVEVELELEGSGASEICSVAGHGLAPASPPDWDPSAPPAPPTEFLATSALRKANDVLKFVATHPARAFRGALMAALALTGLLIAGLLTLRAPAALDHRASEAVVAMQLPALQRKTQAAGATTFPTRAAEPAARAPDAPAVNGPMASNLRATQETPPAPNVTSVSATDSKVIPRPRLAPAEPGALFVDSEPYATLYVDGRHLGVTPVLGLKIPAGTHSLRLVTADGRAQTSKIKIEPGQPFRRRFRW